MIRGPICRMCNVNELVFLGYINGSQVHYCPHCDRQHPREERPDWRSRP